MYRTNSHVESPSSPPLHVEHPTRVVKMHPEGARQHYAATIVAVVLIAAVIIFSLFS